MSEVVRTLTPRFIESPRGVRRALPAAVAAHRPPEHHLRRLSAADRPGPPDRRDRPALQRQARLPRRGAQRPGRARQQHRAEPASAPCSTTRRHDLAAGPPAGHAAAHHPRASPAPRSPSATAPARLGPGHRRRLVRRDPAARRPGRRRHRRRPGPRHARRRRHGPAADRAARLRRRGAHPGHRHGPRLRLPPRARHRPLRDLPVRRGRPDAPASSRSSGPATSTRCSGTPTASAAGCPWTAGCRSASPPSSGGSTTRSPPSSSTPATPCCCAPTASSNSPAPTSTTACGPGRARSATGPQDVQQLADRLMRRGRASAAGDDDVALLLLRRRGRRPSTTSAAGSSSTSRPATPRPSSAARHMIRAAVRAWGARGARRRDRTGRRRADHQRADAHRRRRDRHHPGAAPASERRLRLEVEDPSSSLPRRREPGESGVSGRGLLLVDRLADVWGVEPRGSGKCVWCEFNCS